MKPTRILFVLCLILMGGFLAACSRTDSDDAQAAKAPASQNGVVILDPPTQQRIGLELQALSSVEIQPRFPVTGRVVDPTVLASQAADLVAAEAAAVASQAERKRSQTLAAQNNISERALQSAEAAAVRDESQADAARIKLAATWGLPIANRPDLAGLVDSLAKGESALVRVDLPAGEIPRTESPRVKLSTLAGKSVDATYVGAVPVVDPQTQGRSWFFLVQPNPAGLLSGMAVEGYVEETGPALRGVLVPRAAVVRYEGEGWVYRESNGTNFLRTQIPLDRPVDEGWFISEGMMPSNRVVVAGAQSVLSRELNSSGFQSGERD